MLICCKNSWRWVCMGENGCTEGKGKWEQGVGRTKGTWKGADMYVLDMDGREISRDVMYGSAEVMRVVYGQEWVAMGGDGCGWVHWWVRVYKMRHGGTRGVRMCIFGARMGTEISAKYTQISISPPKRTKQVVVTQKKSQTQARTYIKSRHAKKRGKCIKFVV